MKTTSSFRRNHEDWSCRITAKMSSQKHREMKEINLITKKPLRGMFNKVSYLLFFLRNLVSYSRGDVDKTPVYIYPSPQKNRGDFFEGRGRINIG